MESKIVFKSSILDITNCQTVAILFTDELLTTSKFEDYQLSYNRFKSIVPGVQIYKSLTDNNYKAKYRFSRAGIENTSKSRFNYAVFISNNQVIGYYKFNSTLSFNLYTVNSLILDIESSISFNRVDISWVVDYSSHLSEVIEVHGNLASRFAEPEDINSIETLDSFCSSDLRDFKESKGQGYLRYSGSYYIHEGSLKQLHTDYSLGIKIPSESRSNFLGHSYFGSLSDKVLTVYDLQGKGIFSRAEVESVRFLNDLILVRNLEGAQTLLSTEGKELINYPSFLEVYCNREENEIYYSSNGMFLSDQLRKYLDVNNLLSTRDLKYIGMDYAIYSDETSTIFSTKGKTVTISGELVEYTMISKSLFLIKTEAGAENNFIYTLVESAQRELRTWLFGKENNGERYHKYIEKVARFKNHTPYDRVLCCSINGSLLKSLGSELVLV